MIRLYRLPFNLLLVVLLLSGCRSLLAPAPLPTAAATPTVAPAPAVTLAAPNQVTVKKEQIASKALEGNLLGDPATRDFYVVLPPNYDAAADRYPVVYVLPWGNSMAISNVGGFRTAYQALLDSGEINKMILVFADGSNKLGASLFRSSPTIGDYETYLTEELVGYVDANYRTLPARESRGIAGCSNGGDPTMRLALKYPAVFSVAAPSGGTYDETMATNVALTADLDRLKKLPASAFEVASASSMIAWFIQTAAGSAPNPEQPPLFLDMPFRLVDGKAQIVPEVAARIAAQDSAREAERYVQQPLRLRGILIQHALNDLLNPTGTVRGFEHLLTELGIEHDYVEINTGHCGNPWEAASLKFMSDHLVFDQP